MNKLILIVSLIACACTTEPLSKTESAISDIPAEAVEIPPQCEEAKPARTALETLLGTTADWDVCYTIVGRWTCCRGGGIECCCFFWNCRCSEP